MADDADSPQDGELIERLTETAETIKEDVAEIRAVFQGPIPPPDLLGSYEKVLPGLAERIVAMAERESDHRRTMEKEAQRFELEANNKLVASYIQETHRGQIFAFLISTTAIAAGAVVAWTGAEVAGAVISSTGLIGIVTTFIQGRRKDKPVGSADG